MPNSSALRIAAIARRHKVRDVIVMPIMVNMIDHQRIFVPWIRAVPKYKSTTPPTRMTSRPNLIVENHSQQGWWWRDCQMHIR